MGTKSQDYDLHHMWVVLQQQEGCPVVHSFQDEVAARAFSQSRDNTDKSEPIALARTPLEQSAPLLAAAAQVALEALELVGVAGQEGPLRKAADFLQAALDFARMDDHLASVYREVRKYLLWGPPMDPPSDRYVERMREHLKAKTNIK